MVFPPTLTDLGHVFRSVNGSTIRPERDGVVVAVANTGSGHITKAKGV
jgi:hypothetical protein